MWTKNSRNQNRHRRKRGSDRGGDGSADGGAGGVAHCLRYGQGDGSRHGHHRRQAAGEARRQERQLVGQRLSLHKGSPARPGQELPHPL